MAKYSTPRILPQRGGLRLSDQQRKAATIWYNWYAGGGGAQVPAPSSMICDNITASQIRLFWSEVDGADSYVVEQDGVQVYEGTDTTVLIDSGISQNTSYVFRVKAVVDGKSSGWRQLVVTVPEFYNTSKINSTIPYVSTSARQTSLEPSSATADHAMSWSCWVKFLNESNLAAHTYVFANVIPSTTSQQFGLFLVSSGHQSVSQRLRFILAGDTSTTNYIYIETAERLIKNRWYHVVVTYDGSEENTGFEIYVNGVRDVSPTRSGAGTYSGALDNSGLRFMLGSDQSSRQNPFLLRDLVVANAEFDQGDVNALFNNGTPPVVTGLDLYPDIIAHYPLSSDYSCSNNSALNITGTFQQQSAAINPQTKTIGMQRANIGNTRYLAFGGALKQGANVNVWTRSGTTHLANGKIIKLPIDILSELSSAPIDVITDETLDLRGGSVGIFNGHIYVASSRYNSGGSVFQDSRVYKSTDGELGETFDSGEAIPTEYSRYNFYGKTVELNGRIYIPRFERTNDSSVCKISLINSDDGEIWTESVVLEGGDVIGEPAQVYCSNGTWILIGRQDVNPFGMLLLYSTDDGQTWNGPFQTNLGEGISNCDIVENSVGRLHVFFMDRDAGNLFVSKNNSLADIIANPTAFNAPEVVMRSYPTDSLGVVGYCNAIALGNESYFIGVSCEQSSSRCDYYFGIGKINEPLA